MKKKCKWVCFPPGNMAKILLRMKLLTFFVFISVISFAGNSYSQQTKFKLKLSGATVREVFQEIEDRSEFILLYNEKQLDANRKVDVSVDNETVESILDQTFAGTPNTYKIYDRQIVILSPDMNTIPNIIKSEVELQQKKELNGTVKDSKGMPLPGVSVVVKGTTSGTITNPEGKFNISVSNDARVLVLSFVGMKSQEIIIGNKTSFTVLMEEETLGIEEVVAVGYGVQRKRETTGAMANISEKQLKDIPLQGADDALMGQIAGVHVQQVSGAPGGGMNVKVRGIGSFSAGTQPLYVIDGFPVANETFAVNSNPLSAINPADIKSIDVLKDASATSIYGSRGANGVVIITTKQGESGSAKFDIQSYRGIQEVNTKVDMINGAQYAELRIEEVNRNWMNDKPGINKATDPNSVRPNNRQIPPLWQQAFDEQWEGTDWQKEMFSIAPVTDINLRAYGGNENLLYSVSGGYFDQDGILPQSGYKRYSSKFNLRAKLNPRIEINANFTPTYSKSNLSKTDGHPDNGMVLRALTTPSLFRAYNDDGTFATSMPLGVDPTTGRDFGSESYINPLNTLSNVLDETQSYRTIGNIYLDIQILKDLYLKTEIGADIVNNRAKYYYPSIIRPGIDKAYGISNTSMRINLLNENTLRYKKSFEGGHNFNFLLGYTAQKNHSESNYLRATDFPNDFVKTLNAGTINQGNSQESEWALISYLARINYSYKDKYLFTSTYRTDGSSRFGTDSRWGAFPSASVGWRVTEEPFMESLSFINELKIRASYGLSGNNAIPDYGHVSLLSKVDYPLGTNQGTVMQGLYPSTIPNANLSWEKSKQTDIGLELGFLQNRIYFNADYYHKLTSSLLLSVPVPEITGFTTSLQNIGQIKNSGWEFTLNTKNLVGEFKWGTDFNISFYHTKVLKLGPNGQPLRGNTWFGNTHITEVGQPLGNFLGYIADGVFRTQAELDAGPKWGEGTSNQSALGSQRFKDVTGDGKITIDDRTIIGNSEPDYTFGITNNFSYKNFDLSVLITGVIGNEVLNEMKRYIGNFRNNQQMQYIYDGRYISPEKPGDGTIPALTFFLGNTGTFSSSYVEDGSYVRLRNITLGYTLPKSVTKYIRSARIYAGVKNVYTWTNYSGFNPEISEQGANPLILGVDHGGYPLQRTFLLGINLGF